MLVFGENCVLFSHNEGFYLAPSQVGDHKASLHKIQVFTINSSFPGDDTLTSQSVHFL